MNKTRSHQHALETVPRSSPLYSTASHLATYGKRVVPVGGSVLGVSDAWRTSNDTSAAAAVSEQKDNLISIQVCVYAYYIVLYTCVEILP
jgi:hypothetical protein